MSTILTGKSIRVGEFRVQEMLPAGPMQNPFLLFHHAQMNIGPGSNHREEGVGPHPHKGFSAVTFIYEGGVLHQDSKGNYQSVMAGGVQWTDAAGGIEHSERIPETLAATGGPLELLQVWINSPAPAKHGEPRYLSAEKHELPVLNSECGEWQVVSGTLNGVAGPIRSHSPVTTAMGRMQPGQQLNTEFTQGWQTIVHVLSGEVLVNHQLLGEKQMWVGNGGLVSIEAKTDAKIFLGSGAPIAEPIAAHGPFVMNYPAELRTAMLDYHEGKMGFLKER